MDMCIPLVRDPPHEEKQNKSGYYGKLGLEREARWKLP